MGERGAGNRSLNNNIYSFGAVAQMARALAWHARGQGFKSPQLHHSTRLRQAQARSWCST